MFEETQMAFLLDRSQSLFYFVPQENESHSQAGSASFYRTQVNLGSDLWVRLSVRHKLREVCKT